MDVVQANVIAVNIAPVAANGLQQLRAALILITFHGRYCKRGSKPAGISASAVIRGAHVSDAIRVSHLASESLALD
jgi:hypothetical protein